MASMTFLINDRSTGGNLPVVKVVITENADGSVSFNITQANGYVGDLRGLFFDLADESLIGTLSVLAVAGLTELQQGNDNVVDLGNGANLQGLLGGDSGYDVGVEIGSAGIGKGDDYRSFSFTLKTSDAGGLDLSDFSNVSFGARLTSVGLDSNGDGVFETSRNGSAKIGETTFSVISPGNNAVSLAEDDVASAAGTGGNLLANDGAGAGDTLAITGWNAGTVSLAPGATFTSAALYGATVTIHANGSWTVDASAADALAAGQTVSQTFTYTVLQNNVDGSSTQTASFTVTITGTNDAAVITGQSTAALIETNAAQTIGGDLNATDVDGPATFVAQTNAAGSNGHGSFSIDAAGTWTYTMNSAHDEFVAGQTYNDSVSVATADGTTQLITVTISGSNDAAVLSADVLDLSETNAPLTASGVLTISDVDSPATFVAQTGSAGAHGTFAIDAAGAWTYSAASAHNEFVAGVTYTDTFTVASADGTTTSVTINILGTNDAAVVSSATQTLAETDAALTASGTLTSDDVDNPDNVFVASATAGSIGDFAVDAAGAWTFSANSAFDHLAVGQSVSETFNVASIDGTPSTVTVTIAGTNDAPVAVADTRSGAEDTTITGTVATNDSDIDDGSVLTYALNAAVAGLTINADGSYAFDAANPAYQHLAQGVTSDVVASYTVTDQHGASSTSTLTITLTGTNDTPMAVVDTAAASEDTTITGTVASNDSDVDDGAVLTYTLNAAVAGLALNANGSYSFDASNAAYQHLAQGATTDVVANYTVTDEHGASSASTLTITLTGTNDAPIAVADTNNGLEDSTIMGTVAPNDSDADDGAVLMYALDAPVAGLAIAADGSYTFDASNAAYQHLAQGATQDVVVSYTVTDQHGALSTSTLTITLTGTNDTPVAVADTNSGLEDSTITGTVATNDSDVDDSAVLTYTQVGTVAGLTIYADGSYTFDASNSAYQHLAQGATTDVVASYTVTDQHSAASTSTLTITLTGTNDTPVAVADTNSGAEDTTISGTVATNDSDVDDGAVLSYAQVGAVAGLTINADGSYSFDAGNAVYQHLAQGATQDVVASYTVTDQHGASAASTLTITLTGTNDAPVAVADTNAGNEDTIISGTVATSDSDGDDGAVLTYATTGPVPAGLTLNSNGSYSFDASNAVYQHLAQGAIEVVTVGYTVTDEHGAFATSTLTITLTGTNDAPIAVADSNAGNEDTTIAGTVATNDSDVDDGAVLTYATTGPLPAGLTFNSNGAYSFDAGNAAYQHLAQGATEVAAVGYTVTDEHGAAAASTLTITLTGTNDTPVAVADVNSGNEDAIITGAVAANDSDVDDGAVLTYATTGPLSAGLSFNSNGSYSFDAGNAAYQHLAQGATEVLTVGYTVTDEHGAFATSTLTITLTGTNDVPVAVVDSNSGLEDATITGTVATNDSDVDDGAVLTYATTGLVPAGLTFNSNGSYSFDASNAAYQHLAQGATEVVTVGYTVTDEHGASATSTLTITLTGTNDTPIAVADVNSGNEDTIITGTVATNDSDVDDGAVLTYATTGSVPSGLTFNSNGAYSFDASNAAYQHLAQGATEIVTVNYTVTDEHGASATSTLTITLTGTNDTPVAVADTNAGSEDTTITGTVATNDSDVDDGAVLSYATTGPVPAGLTFNSNGSYSFDAGNAVYQHLAQGATEVVTVGYTVTDEHGAFSTSTLTITLTGTNDTPVAVADTNAGNEDTTISGTVATNDSDVDDGAVLTYATIGPVPAGLTFNSNGSYTFDAGNTAYQHLAQGATEVVTVGYTVTDEHGAVATSTLTITLTGTNDTPVAVADTNAGNEDTTISGTVATNDSDVDDGAVLTYATTGPVPAGLTLNSNGSYSFDANNAAHQHLAQGAIEVVTVGYTVTDEHGASATSTLTITLTGTNDTPAAVADTNAGNEDTTVSGTVATNDSDVDDGAMLSYATTGPVPAGLTFNSNGSYSFDAGNAAYQHLAQGATEVVTVNYTVTDEHGASATSTLSITLTGTNDTPVAVADSNVGDAVIESGVNPGNTPFAGDASASGNVLANDTDVDDGTVTSVVNTGTQTGTYGSLLLNADGSWTYSLNNADTDTNALTQGQAAAEVFSYTMQDQFGATSSSTLTISITGTNDAPVAAGDSASGNEDSAITTGNVLANDSDVDQTLTAANITAFTQAANGTVVNNGNGTFTYNPNADFNGSDSFTYTITDAFGATSTASVNLTVAAVNDAPAATITPVSYSATEQISLSLKNNGLAVSDVDAAGGTVTVTLSVGEGTLNVSAGGSGATVANSGTGSITISGTVAQINALLNTDATSSVAYIDNTDTPGASTTLSLSVNDNGNTGSGGSLTSTDTATIAITAVNDAPVNNGLAAFSTNEDTAKAITGLSISDADAGAGTVTTTLSVAHGTLVVSGGTATISGSGTASVTLTGTVAAINATLAATVSYTPQLNYAGSDTLTMSTNDGGNSGSGGAQSDSDTVTATVISVNDNPVVAADRLIVSTNTAVSISTAVLLANDIDIDGAALTITSVGGATGITGLTLNANGTVSFTSGNTAGATAGSFTYTVSDGNGGTATATVTIDVRTIGNGNNVDTIDLTAAGTYQASYIDAAGGADILTGGAAGDTFLGSSGNDNLLGASGNDLLIGGDNNDTLAGGAGNDVLRGGQNNDDIDGGAGTEDLIDFSDATAGTGITFTLTQSTGNTTFNTHAGTTLGTDTYRNIEGVIGTSSGDTLTGSTSNDIIRGGAGNDTINGAAGAADLINFSDGTAGLNFTLTQSVGLTSFNASAAGLGTDQYQNIEGVIGTNFADTLTGSTSADVLRGGGGNDTINGGAGADRIAGGTGADSLTGGTGADTFVFDSAPNAVDTVSDFEAAGTDLVELSLATFTALTTASGATLGSGEFASSNGGGAGDAVGAGVHVIYDSATGNLYYDSDGLGSGNRTLIASITITDAGTFDFNDIKVGP